MTTHATDPKLREPCRSTWLVHRDGGAFSVAASHLHEALALTDYEWTQRGYARHRACQEAPAEPMPADALLVGVAQTGKPTSLADSRAWVCVWVVGQRAWLHTAPTIDLARQAAEAARLAFHDARHRYDRGVLTRDGKPVDFDRVKSGAKKGEVKWPRGEQACADLLAAVSHNRHLAAELAAAEEFADAAEGLLERMEDAALWSRAKTEWTDAELASVHARLLRERGTDSGPRSVALANVEAEVGRRLTVREHGFDVGARVLYRMPVYGLNGIERYEQRRATVVKVAYAPKSRGFFGDDPTQMHRRVVRLDEPFIDIVTGEAITVRGCVCADLQPL